MAENIFTYLSIIIGVVLVSLGIMKLLRQPMIIGYIVAWTLISIFVPQLLQDNHAIETFASIGISFLLFIVWLELNPKIIEDVGKTSILAWTLQVFITAILWRAIGMLLGFELTTALYMWVGFAFSSTIVILKLLSDKGTTESVHGRSSIGILIVQDLIVMLLFVAISTFEKIQGGGELMAAMMLLGKTILLGGGLYLVGKYLLPIATKKIAESQEHLFLFSIWRCLILGSLFYVMWFSIEIWALVAGMTLASSNYKFEIMSKVKPLRDFFVIMFFVLLGSRIIFPIPYKFILPIIVFTLFILIVKPLIINIILWRNWHTKKNSFLTGISLGQVSEFSFLLIMIGISYGHLKDPSIVSLITIIWLITIAISSYGILYGEKIFEHIRKTPRLFKILPGKIKEYRHKTNKKYEILLFGYGRFGSEIFQTLTQKSRKKIFVIDEDPDIIKKLQKKSIPCIYGDAGEIDFLNEIDVQHAKMIVSTIKDYDANMLLLKYMKRHNPHIIIIIVSHNTEQAINFYKEGADYIILPHQIGAHHASGLLESYGFDIKKFIEQKESQLLKLKKSKEHNIVKLLENLI